MNNLYLIKPEEACLVLFGIKNIITLSLSLPINCIPRTWQSIYLLIKVCKSNC